VSWDQLSPGVFTVEAVRATIAADNAEASDVTERWLDLATAEGLDVMEAAGLLLRDAYGFAGILARSLARDDPESVEVLMDAYCLAAMEDA
jgi:hypothetical protein